ncbi:keratin, ultra high-sulfur matrix protein-like [Eriocheir sinensis]|uniref:keratin, ultra high-sulfur matrix protein-like n=1 Tax=Eriocheir sinensis TaxID=95602 RepID=UPI0021CAAA3E|nr:keratin, ultra high-sulfur matrix protein-like [Eriocheir sinensis]
MRTALVVGLLTLLALARCEPEAGGEKHGDDSRTVDADTTKILGLRDQPQELHLLLGLGLGLGHGRCLMQTGCIAAGGFCFRDVQGVNTPDCDFRLNDRMLCGSNCKCCLNCSEENCGDSGSGTCKADCDEGEFTRENCGASPCKCCEPCEAATCAGRCVGDPDSCNPDEYVGGDCGFGSCSCCATCEAGFDCEAAGGECVNVNTPCEAGTWPNLFAGCNDGSCQCCATCNTSSECADQGNPGRCVNDDMYCSATNEYITSDPCGDDTSCFCCKTCLPDPLCEFQGGQCVNNEDQSGSCAAGYEPSECGGCNTDDCTCCVPE